MIDYVRTPDACFDGLDGFGFAPQYAMVEPGGLRMHYLDEGPRHGHVVVLLHGEPSWCYLYRNVIPLLTRQGYRCIAPDLIGFGRSDKPVRRGDYTYARHLLWLEALIVGKLNLTDITLFCQDWGGLLGLRLVAKFPERFARVVVSNTGLPKGQGATPSFEAWLAFSQQADSLDISALFVLSCVKALSDEIKKGYDAPFPDKTYQAGALQFPLLVPITDNDDAKANKKAWEALAKFNKPFLCAFSDQDPITRGGEHQFIGVVPGTRNQKHVQVKDGGHFVQEDQPEEIAKIIHSFIQANPLPSSKL